MHDSKLHDPELYVEFTAATKTQKKINAKGNECKCKNCGCVQMKIEEE